MGSFGQSDFGGRNTVVAGRIEYSGVYTGSRTVEVTLKMYGARVDDGSVASNCSYSATTSIPSSWNEEYSLTTGTTASVFKNKIELHLITRKFTVTVDDTGSAQVNMNFSITATSSSSYTVTLNVTKLSFGKPPYTARTIYITATEGVNVSVKRTASPSANAYYGDIVNYDTVYDNDVLEISYSAKEGYYVTEATVNYNTVSGFTQITVSGNVYVEVAAALHYFMMSVIAGDGITVTVDRKSSKAGAATGILTDGSYVYYSDEIEITYEARPGYEVKTSTINDDPFESGDIITVKSGLNIVVLSGALGLVYINGEAHQVYVGNGSGWDMHAPYLGNGSKFDLCS